VPIARVGDINIEYYVEGDGPPLLLIQGFSMSASAWGEPFLAELRPHFQVIRFSNRGTGQTDKPDAACSIPMMADDAVGLLDELSIGKAHVMGISMGGSIAQELVLSHPERVLGLVLGCTACGGPQRAPAEPQAIAMLAATPGLSAIDWVKRLAPVTLTPEYVERERDALEAFAEEFAENPTPPHVMGRHAGAGMLFDSYDRLPQMQVQTLIMHCDRDRLNPVQNAQILHDRIPNSKLRIVPEVGHSFFWEKPGESAEAIMEFLSSVPAPA